MAKRDGGISLAATFAPRVLPGAIVTLITAGTNAMTNAMMCYLTKERRFVNGR